MTLIFFHGNVQAIIYLVELMNYMQHILYFFNSQSLAKHRFPLLFFYKMNMKT